MARRKNPPVDVGAVDIPRDWLSRAEAAEWLGKSVNTLDRMIHAGELRAYKVGGSVRIREADLQAVIQDKRAS